MLTGAFDRHQGRGRRRQKLIASRLKEASDSAADVQAYLGIAPGQIITEPERSRLEHQLWLSGRYLSQSVKVVPAAKAGETTELRIKLKDYAEVAGLSQPLPSEDQAILKCRQWALAGWPAVTSWSFAACPPVRRSRIGKSSPAKIGEPYTCSPGQDAGRHTSG